MAVQELQPGTLLRQYKVQKVLGVGGFAVTYLVEDEKLGRLYAIKEYFPEAFAYRGGKMVKPNAANVDDFVWGKERFLAEARVLARFRHPNIVGVTQIFELNGTAYMVLEYRRGRSFKDWLAELGRPPTQAELDAIAEPLLSALETIHRNDLLHRDIAPDNVYVCEDGTPLLLDFGSAREAIAQRSKALSAIVKSGYSPPEQYSTRGTGQGPWSDIYALAATLYQAVAGEHPEEATDRLLTDSYVPARQAAKGEFRPGFLDAIDWGLKLSPQDRPQSAADWRPALLGDTMSVKGQPESSAVADQAAPAKHVESAGAPRPPSAGKSRSKVSMAAYAAAALLLIGAVLTWVNLDGKPTDASSGSVQTDHQAEAKPNTPVRPPAEPTVVTQKVDDTAAREDANFAAAVGDIDRLRAYLTSCRVCAHAATARSQIAELQEKARIATEQANYFNLRICNQTAYAAAVAIAGHKEVGPVWSVLGWRVVDANACRQVGRFAKGKVYTMALVHNELRGWFGSDTKQCVEFPGPFDRVVDKNATCPTTGKVFGFVEQTVTAGDHTWYINGEPTIPDTAYFNFEVCNHSRWQTRVAVMGRKNPLTADWTVEGWFPIEPNACGIVGKYARGRIYSVALVRNRPGVKTSGKDIKLCVEFPGPFHRLHTAQYKCRRNERLESFGLIDVGQAGKFTLNLNAN